MLEHLVADEALVDAAQRLHEPLKHALQSADDCREVLQQTPAVELPDIMSNSLDTKYTFAF
jgi:DNA-binding FrmR family transcriptional regulator